MDAGLCAFFQNIGKRFLLIDMGIRIRHQHNTRHTASRRRHRAGQDIFLIFCTRITEMHMGIHQPGAAISHPHSGCEARPLFLL